MKKKLLLLLLALTLLLFCFSLASCGDDETEESGKGEYCEHVWTSEYVREATCTEYGEKHLRCSVCGDKNFEQIPVLGHDVIISEGRAATCTEGGLTDGKICNRCNEIIEEQSYISPLGHNIVTDEGSDPTCTEEGISDGTHCSVCNTVFDEQYIIDPTGHSWEYQYGYSASCTEAGLTEGKFCWICDYVETAQEIIPATGHTPETDEGYDATCLEEGLTDGSHCSVCFDTITEREPIPAKGHTIVALSDVPATCQKDGIKGGKECSVCKVVFENPTTIKKVDHSFKNGSCQWCSLTHSAGLEFAEVGNDAYALSGIGSFSGEILVIPDKHEEKPVIGISSGALRNQAQLKEIIATGKLEYIEADAFSGCTALVSVTLPESVTDVESGAFNGCPALVTVKCVDFSQTEEWENGWRGDSSSASLSADEKDGLTPYELYLAAMNYINSNLDSYTAIDNTRLVMDRDQSYPSEISQFIGMLEMETYTVCEYSGLEFYLYQKAKDYTGSQSSATWYYNGYFYQNAGGVAQKVKCGSEFIRAQFATASEKRAQFTDKFFNSVKFYLNDDGTYTLLVDVSGDAMTEFLASQEGGSFVGQTGFSYTDVVYTYVFDADGKLMTCSCVADFIFENITVDAQGNPLSLTGAVLLDQIYSDVGTLSTLKTKPSGSFTDITPPNLSSCAHPSYAAKTVTGVPATCTEAGVTDGVYCGACLQNVTASAVIEPLGHKMVDGKCERCQLEDAPKVNLFFEFNEDGKTATLIGVSEVKGDELVIPSAIHGVAITGIDKDAFKNLSYIKSIFIPSSVTEIEEGALEGIMGLQKISLPASLLASLPSDITEVVITEGKTIPAASFVDFKYLFKITLPETLESIEDGAFVGCDRLLVISNYSNYIYNISAGSTEFGGIALNAEEILYRTSNSSLIIFGDYVFKNNVYIGKYELIKYFGNEEHVVLPEKVNGLEYLVHTDAFSGASNMKSIIAPAFADATGDFPSGCTSLVYVEGNASFVGYFTSSYYVSYVEEIVVIGSSSSYTYFLEDCDTIKKATFYVPLGNYALCGCDSLETVILGEGVTSIGANSFSNCPALKNVYISEDVESIGGSFLSGSTEGYDIYIEDLGAWCETDFSSSLYYIPTILYRANAVYFDGELATDLTVPEGVAVISEYAFYGLKSLTSISLPSSLVEIKSYAFQNCNNLERVTFAEGLTTIGSDAFSGASSLKEAILPETLNYLGSNAFQGCTSLTTVYIPALVSIIRENCFYDCISLSTLTISEESQMTDVSSSAFRNCRRLTGINIPSTVTFLGSRVFYGCSALKEIDLSELQLTEISLETFYKCSSLKQVSLPENLKTIGEKAFYNTGLITVTLPESLTAIGNQAFYDCSSLLEVVNNSASLSVIKDSADNGYVGKYAAIITTGESTLNYVGDFGFISTDSAILVVDYVGASRHVVFPENYNGFTYEIPKSVFRYSDFLTVVISDGVTKIGEYAFANSYDLISVSLGSSLTSSASIGRNAFLSCDKLIEIINRTPLTSFNSNTGLDVAKLVHSEESKIDYVDDFAFVTIDGVHYLVSYLGYAETIVLPESYEGNSYSLYSQAFYYDGAKEIILNENVNGIPRNAFDLSSVRYNAYGNVKYIGTADNPYYLAIGIIDEGIEDVVLHDDTVEILERAFEYSSFDTFTFNSSLKIIGASAFYNAKFGIFSGTPTVSLPASLEVIRDSAFYYSGIEYLDLGGVKRIEDHAFASTNVHDIVIPEGVTYMGYGVFDYCGRSTANIYYNAKNATTPGSRIFAVANSARGINLVIGAGVETIPDYLLYSSSENYSYNFYITSFTLTTPETLKKVGAYTFYKSSLTEISLPAIEEIGTYAFGESALLTSVSFGDTLVKIGSSAFYNCDSLENLSIPSGAELGENLFLGCDKIKSLSLPLKERTLSSLFVNNVPSTLTKVTLVGDTVCNSALKNITSITEIEIASTVKNIEGYAFSNTKISKISLPVGLEDIGPYVFTDCVNLTEATIPSSVSSIGKYIFSRCSKLEYLEIPFMGSTKDANDYTIADFFNSQYASVPSTLTTVKITNTTAIPGNAFYGDGRFKITTVILPENLESIGSSAFYGLTTLTSVNIPDSVKTIGGSAFWNCPNLSEINIPASLTVIEHGTFGYCKLITEINIPEGVTHIYDSAFYKCDAVTSISLPSTLEYVGADVFPNITDTSKLYAYDNAYYLGNESNNYVLLYKAISYDITSCEIAETTKVIGARAFNCCSALTDIEIPDGVKGIGAEAFSYCTKLTKIEVPDSVKIIGDSAFEKVSSVNVIVIGDGVESIGYRAFNNIGEVESLTLGSSVTKIMNDAFGGTYVKNLYIASIDDYLEIEFVSATSNPFSQETNLYVGNSDTPLTELTVSADVTRIPNYSFAGFGTLKSLIIEDGVKEIGWSAFNSSGVETVDFGETLELIEASAFAQCTNLTYVTFPASLTKIGQSAFSNSGIKAVYIPETVTALDSYAFAYGGAIVVIEAETRPSGYSTAISDDNKYVKYGLDEPTVDENGVIYVLDGTTFTVAGVVGNSGDVVIKNKIGEYPVQEISPYAFRSSKITGFTAGANLRILPENAFRDSTHLKSVDLSATLFLSDISRYAFYNCSELESVILAPNVVSISDYAFYSCKKLSDVEFSSMLSLISNYAFYEAGFTELVIPDTVKTVGNYAFGSCRNLETLVIGNGVTLIGANAFMGSNALTEVTFKNAEGWSADGSAISVSATDLAQNAKLIKNNARKKFTRV